MASRTTKRNSEKEGLQPKIMMPKETSESGPGYEGKMITGSLVEW